MKKARNWAARRVLVIELVNSVIFLKFENLLEEAKILI